MTTVEELCAEVVGRVERTICRGCGATDIEIDRSGLGHVIWGAVPDQCGPVETVEEDQLCGHPESEHLEMRDWRGDRVLLCTRCSDERVRLYRHAYRAPEAA